MMKRAQVAPVTLIVLMTIMLSLVSAAYVWGLPLIQKREDILEMNNITNFFNLLNSKIDWVAKYGGTEVIRIKDKGIFTFYSYDSENGNSIVFNSVSRGSTLIIGKWIPINTENSGDIGILGNDEIGIIEMRSDPHDKGYEFSLRLRYRELHSGDRGYKIELMNPKKIIKTTDGHIIISLENEKIENIKRDGKKITLITKIIKISFD